MDKVREGFMNQQKAKILFLTNNEQAHGLYAWIKTKEDITCNLLQEKIKLEILEEFNPDLIISYGYRYIIKNDVIERWRGKIINLHISFLPWNKGADPNFWSFIENTPKGVTIHLIDEGIDTGDILFQKEVNFDDESETLSSSYNKLQDEIQNLFKENWNQIKKLTFKPIRQGEEGTIHYKKDFDKRSFLIKEKGWDITIKELKQNYNNHMRSYEKR